MQTTVLDGRLISGRVLDNVRTDAEKFLKSYGRKPGLAVIHTGADAASAVYIRNKEKACISNGIDFELIDFPATVTIKEILDAIDRKNETETCDGIIVQLPLPSADLDEHMIIHRISVEKDVDGFHPETIGNLWSGFGTIAPCTPAGVIELLQAYQVPMAGKNAVIVGRSNIVGKPMAALLLRENATVTIAHSKTVDLPAICRSADILIAAVGKPGLIGRNCIKPGAIVIDVGINRITQTQARPEWLNEGTEIGRKLVQKGTALVGDVDPLAVEGLASMYTPVPGGVGLMTVAILLKNTLTLAQARKSAGIR